MIDTSAEPRPFGLLWTVAEHFGKRGAILWDKNLYKDTLFVHPLQIDDSLRGNNLFEFIKEKSLPVMNACVWEYLKENTDEIPEVWKFSAKKGEQYIFFWGTIDRSNTGDLYVRYLSWSGGNWIFSNYLLSGNWHEDFPAAVYEKVKL
jgi:hypothetical protein